MKKYALISVFDKSGIEDLAKALVKNKYTIISTGGTAKALEKAGIPHTPITEITGNPEAFDGRMKTISFQVESGILFDRKKASHVKQAKELNIPSIDVVICNLYPFEQTIAREKVTLSEAVENIDVGGPTMIRSAAKNFQNVMVVVNPSDYEKVIVALKTKITMKLRKQLAAKAFQHLSYYDGQIGHFLSEENFPKEYSVVGKKSFDLRYGENPHQQGAFYTFPNTKSPLTRLTKQWGRGLSATNVTDMYAGLESVQMFTQPAAVVIKHNTPCGIALGVDSAEALKRAISADPESAFGGVIVLNKSMTLKTAKAIGDFKDERKSNIDIVAVPEIDPKALEYLQTVRKSMGIYTFGDIPKKQEYMHLRFLNGGFIIQTQDMVSENLKNWKAVTKVKPTKLQLKQMKLGWQFVSRVRSNTILVIDKIVSMTRGIGSGQTSRIGSAKIALAQAGEQAKGAILVSDGLFPFPDCVELAVESGISAVIQPGGSINDQLSIDVANKAGISMVFTGKRAFWH